MSVSTCKQKPLNELLYKKQLAFSDKELEVHTAVSKYESETTNEIFRATLECFKKQLTLARRNAKKINNQRNTKLMNELSSSTLSLSEFVKKNGERRVYTSPLSLTIPAELAKMGEEYVKEYKMLLSQTESQYVLLKDLGARYNKEYDASSRELAELVRKLQSNKDYYSARSEAKTVAVPSKEVVKDFTDTETKAVMLLGSAIAASFCSVFLIHFPLYYVPIACLVLVGAFFTSKKGRKNRKEKQEAASRAEADWSFRNTSEVLVPLNYTSALALIELKNLCAHVADLVDLVPDKLNGIQTDTVSNALLTGEVLLAKRQKVMNAARALKADPEKGNIEVDLNNAASAVATLEKEFDTLFANLKSFCTITQKISGYTKSTKLRQDLYKEIDGVVDASVNAYISSETLEQSRIAQEALLATLQDMHVLSPLY